MLTKKSQNILVSLLIIISVFGLVLAIDSAMIWTDKDDYAPEEVVLISGEGFDVGALTVQVTRPDSSVESCDDSFCDSTIFLDGALTTPDGSFSNYSYLLNGIEGLYNIDVSDGTNFAETNFTDSTVWTTDGEAQQKNDFACNEPVGADGSGLTESTTLNYEIKDKSSGGNVVASGTLDTDAAGDLLFSIVWNVPIFYPAGGQHKLYVYDSQTKTKTFTVGCTCVDNDQDTYPIYDATECPTGNDCNDNNAAINPGATEVCANKIDDDCDTLIDCDDSNCQPCVTIIAHKIVCNSEADLPDWSGDTVYIGSSTADDYVTSHPNCHFENDWNFQWAFDTSNPGNNLEHASSPWTTFGPTDSNGQTSIIITNANSKPPIWFREELKSGYILFSGVGGSDVTAEFYCDGDVLNYDNYDYIKDPIIDKSTYYCVAFNALLDHECETDADCKPDNNYCNGDWWVHESESCVNHQCLPASSTANCNDGQYCNGEETCEGEGICTDPADIDCSGNDISGIATCNNNPDSNPDTFDYRTAFTSQCDEDLDSCTTGDDTINHACADGDDTDGVFSWCVTQTCSAECDGAGTECEPYLDGDTCYYDGSCNTAPTVCACSYSDEYCPPAGTINNDICYYGTRDCLDTGNPINGGCTLMSAPMGCYDTCDSVNGPIDTTGPVTSIFNAEPLPPQFDVNVLENVWKTVITALETEDCTDIESAEYFVKKSICFYPDDSVRGTPMYPNDGTFDDIIEGVNATVEFYEGQDGLYCIMIRGQNSDGYWGDFICNCINVDTEVPKSPTNVIIDPYICNQNRTINATICDDQTNIIDGEFYLDIAGDWIPGGEGNNMEIVMNYELPQPEGTYYCADLTGTLDITNVADGCHYVRLHGQDEAGNWGKPNPDYENEFILDATAPRTEKEIIGDKIPCSYTDDGEDNNLDAGCYYTKQGTQIVLTGHDNLGEQDPDCRAESFKTYYRMRWKETLSESWPAWPGQFTEYTLPITLTEDSVHEIEFFSNDSCGNEEEHHFELDIVDTVPPNTTKEIIGPQVDGDGNPIHKYLTKDSTIILNCTDVMPHPVGGEVLHWEMFWSYNDLNSWELISSGTEEGYKEFTDLNDSYHKFVYWCEDALGNPSQEYTEIDAVDNQKPIITKKLVGP